MFQRIWHPLRRPIVFPALASQPHLSALGMYNHGDNEHARLLSSRSPAVPALSAPGRNHLLLQIFWRDTSCRYRSAFKLDWRGVELGQFASFRRVDTANNTAGSDDKSPNLLSLRISLEMSALLFSSPMLSALSFQVPS